MQEMQEGLQEMQQSGAANTAPDAAEQNKTEAKGKTRFADVKKDGAGFEQKSGEADAESFRADMHRYETGGEEGDVRRGEAASAPDDGEKLSLAGLLSGDPELKREYDEAVRKIINKRFRTNRENEARLRRVDELMPAISRSFGTPDGDLDALSEAVGRAEEKTRAAAERETRGRAALYSKWDREIPQAEAMFPGFDMRREMADPRFARLAVTVGVVEAYETVHRRELDRALIALARREAAAAVAGSVAANATRPAEGGLANTSAGLVKADPRSLTREERLEVRRRLKRGEKIRF